MKDFGVFKNVRKVIQEGDGYPEGYVGMVVVDSIAEDGKTWIEIYKEFSVFNGPFFISSEYKNYAVVEADGRIRMNYYDPSMVSPNDGDRIIAREEVFTIEDYYNAETGEVYTPAPVIPPISIPASIFLGRVSDDEYDALDDSIRSGESSRVYRSWTAPVSTYDEGTALWDLITKHLDLTVGEQRRGEILARPEQNSMSAGDAPQEA